MKLYEYQGKEIFRAAGIPVPRGNVVASEEELEGIRGELSLPLVAKAQVLAGGRGKAGYITKCTQWEEVKGCLKGWIGQRHRGEKIRSVLLEEALDIHRELYMAVTFDPASGSPMVMASTKGGVDIEEVSSRDPQAVICERINVFRGLRPYHVRWVVSELGLEGQASKEAGRILSSLYELYRRYDAELVEINPLIVDTDGRLWAADAKFRIDDNALFRQDEFSRGPEQFEDPLEYEASQHGLSYVKLDGDIGILCTGAGLTMTVVDLIHMAGGRPANFLEFGGATYKNAANALQIALKNPSVRVLLIVTFGLVARADVIAEGLVQAIQELRPKVPIVAAVRGTGEEKARELIHSIGIETYEDTEAAVRKAVELAEGR
jgi:succinyl-CoA synthetase beta subunit